MFERKYRNPGAYTTAAITGNGVTAVNNSINQADAYAQMNGFANAAQMQAYMNAMQQSQNTLNAADQFIASGSTTNPYATGNSYQMLTQMQAPAGNNLGFNELYSSPYTEMI